MPKLDVLTATASDLQRAYAEGSLSVESAISQYLDQITACNRYLKAVISVAPTETLLERASFKDKERAEGRARGPLHGVPIIVKVF
jgi:amidase